MIGGSNLNKLDLTHMLPFGITVDEYQGQDFMLTRTML